MKDAGYGADSHWRYQNIENGFEKVDTFSLAWELSYENVTSGCTPTEDTACQVWDRWMKAVDWARQSSRYNIPHGAAPIGWTVHDAAEALPFMGEDEDFLTFFTWPTHVHTGERLQWSRLPVMDRRWVETDWTTGGFVQEATGWKPSAFQPWVDVHVLAQAAGLPGPPCVPGGA